MIFKVMVNANEESDTLYIEADSQPQARNVLFHHTGPIPDNMLSWQSVKTVPENIELL
jgi:hypothetical protein